LPVVHVLKGISAPRKFRRMIAVLVNFSSHFIAYLPRA